MSRGAVQRRSRPLPVALVMALALLLPAAAGGAVVSRPKPDPTAVANAIAQDPTRIVSASYVGQPYTVDAPGPVGIGTPSLAGFPTAGGSFAVMTSGNAEFANEPQSFFASRSNGIGPPNLERGARAFDFTVLKVDVNVPSSANCAGFDFRFASEEFPGFVNRGFNDIFIAEIDRTTWTATPTGIIADDDIAASTGDRITVDTLGATGLTAANGVGTAYGGASAMLSARAKITPGRHAIYFSISDVGDPNYDSAVFIDNLRFSNEPAGTCSFSGAGDQTPPGLIVCGPVGTILPPCDGLLPAPRPLTVCGPRSGTILRSCEGLALGLGPKPFIGDASWEPLFAKCDDRGETCNVDIDAELNPKDNRGFSDKPGVRPPRSSRTALRLGIGGLGEASYELFDAARALEDLAGRLGGDPWLAGILGDIGGDIVTEFGPDNDLLGLGRQSLVGINDDTLADYRSVLSSIVAGLGNSNPLISQVEPESAGDLTRSLITRTRGLLGQLVNGLRGTGGLRGIGDLLSGMQGRLPALPPAFVGQIDDILGQLGVRAQAGGTELEAIAKAIAAADDRDARHDRSDDWGRTQELQGRIDDLFQVITRMQGQISEMAGQMIGRMGASPPPPDPDGARDLMGRMLTQLGDLNQISAQIFMNQAALNGIVGGTGGPDQRMSGSFSGAVHSLTSRMLSQLGLGQLLNGVLQEGSLAFPASGTQALISALDPRLLTTAGQSETQRLGAVFDSLSGLMRTMSSIMAQTSRDGTRATIENLRPRIPLGALERPRTRGKKKGKGKKRPVALQLGSVGAVIAPGRTAKLRLRLTKRGKRALKGARKRGVRQVVVRLRVRGKDGSGRVVTRTYKFTVANGKKNRSGRNCGKGKAKGKANKGKAKGDKGKVKPRQRKAKGC